MSRSTRSSRTSARSPSRGRGANKDEEEETLTSTTSTRGSRARSNSRARGGQAASEAPTRGRSRSASRTRRGAAAEEAAPAKKETKRRNDGFDPKTAAAETSSSRSSRNRSRSRDRPAPETSKKRSSSRGRRAAEEEEEEVAEEQVAAPKTKSRSRSRGRQASSQPEKEEPEAEGEEAEKQADSSADVIAEAQAVIESDSSTVAEVEKASSALEAQLSEVQNALEKAKGGRRATRQTRELEAKLDNIVSLVSAAQHKLQGLREKGEEVEAASEKPSAPAVRIDSSFYKYLTITVLLFFLSKFLVLLCFSTHLRDCLAGWLKRVATSYGLENIITQKTIRCLTQPTMSVLGLSLLVSTIQLTATFPLRYWTAEKHPNSFAARRFVRFVGSLICSVSTIAIWLHFNAYGEAESTYAHKALLVFLFASSAHALVAYADSATVPHVAECAIQLFASAACLFLNKSMPIVERSAVLVLFLRACALSVHSISSVGLFALSNQTAVSRGMTAVAYACSYLYFFVILITPLTLLVRGFKAPYYVNAEEALSALTLIGLNAFSLLDGATPANSAIPFSE